MNTDKLEINWQNWLEFDFGSSSLLKYGRQCFGFVFSALSCLFFTSNSAVFGGRGAKIFFAPGLLVP